MTLTNPGPATSTSGDAAQVGGVEHRLGHLAGGAAELLGERQRAVRLGVGMVGRAHHRIDAGAPGDRVERRPQTVGEELQRIGHGNRQSAVPGHGAAQLRGR